MIATISYCGLLCQSCPIYLATRETDLSKKQKLISEIIRACKEHYGIEYKYEDINDCDGCTSDIGRLFIGCKDCKIRTCAVQKGIENCAHCDDYPCDELNKTFEAGSGAKERLDTIRISLKN
jgi:hypothetical protein